VEPITWKFHTLWQPDYVVVTEILDPWAEEVERRTNGRLKIEYYHAGALGFKGADILRALSGDATEAGVVTTGHVAGDWPEPAVLDLPTLFSSPSDLYYNGYDNLKDTWDKEFQEQWGLKVLFFMSADEQMVLSKKPLTKISDFKGQKIRSFYPAMSDMLQALGASAVTVPFMEMYSALEKGTVDGAGTGLMAHNMLKNYEVTEYGFWGIGIGGFAPMFASASPGAWEALPADIQDLLMELRDEYSAKATVITAERMGEEYAKVLVDNGITMTKASAEEVAIAQELATTQVWEKWLAQVGPLGRELLDAILKARGQ